MNRKEFGKLVLVSPLAILFGKSVKSEEIQDTIAGAVGTSEEVLWAEFWEGKQWDYEYNWVVKDITLNEEELQTE